MIDIHPPNPFQIPEITALLQANQLPVDGFPSDTPVILAAQADDRIAGAAALEIHGEYALLRSLVVDTARRGQGVGARLIAAALQEARRRKLKAVYLLTETAADYFPRFGFAAIERRAVPEIVRRSVEFTTACPDTAAAMTLEL